MAISTPAAGNAERAGEHGGISSWASGRSGSLDRQWAAITRRWAPEGSGPRGARAAERGIMPRERSRTRSRDLTAPPLPSPGIGEDWTRSDRTFTTYTDGMLFRDSTRPRRAPTRGVSTLTSPAASTRGSSRIGFTPFNRKANYTHTIHTKGRNPGERLSPPLHTRATRNIMMRTPSTLHGANRPRRQPIRGRW